jgi:ATP-dependent DNA helicase DinG
MSKLCVVIATSSIALQNALVNNYIPELSKILFENDVIEKPLTCILRKGKEHYICEKNLRNTLAYEINPVTRGKLQAMLQPRSSCDLADYDGISAYLKRKICVSRYCDYNCEYHSSCRYLDYVASAKSPEVDFQITNHNYLLADILRRSEGKPGLLPPYQAVVIDEAHKFPQTAQQMYGITLTNLEIPEAAEAVFGLKFLNKQFKSEAEKLAVKTKRVSNRLFELLREVRTDDSGDSSWAITVNAEIASRLARLRTLLRLLLPALAADKVQKKQKQLRKRLERRIEDIEQTVAIFQTQRGVMWLEKENGVFSFRSAPDDLGKQLHRDLFGKGVPIILTSGTLSAGGDFGYIRNSMGLENLPDCKLTQISEPSPFDFRNNALLYLSENVPFPDQSKNDYITAVADETERLIQASHGHAAVLFTSYKVMDMVWEILRKRRVPFPLFRLDKGGSGAIDRFKQSKSGVLFASGALWEGIDIPGDALSMLIIVKLPFAVPDPVMEYEKAQYPDFSDYLDDVLVPEMLIKLKQGFGRLIRNETDTGVVAILDSRINKGGTYRERVLHSLPNCCVTDNITDVENFVAEKKAPEYFI